MWLEAILSRHDLEQVLRDLTPTTIQLREDGELHLDSPTSVRLAAGEGLRIVCGARLRWSVLGVHVPITIASVTVLLEPTVRHRKGEGDVLAFHLKLEDFDVAALPHIVESRVVERINAELTHRHTELVWDFRETLSHRFELPELLEPARSLDVGIAWGEIRITEEALVFAISIHMKARRAMPVLLPVVVPIRYPPPRVPFRARLQLTPARVALAGSIAALSISAAGFAIGGLLAHRRRRHFLDLWSAFA